MPQPPPKTDPPFDAQHLLEQLLQVVQDERLTAASRHDEILFKLVQQHEHCCTQFNEANSSSLAVKEQVRELGEKTVRMSQLGTIMEKVDEPEDNIGINSIESLNKLAAKPRKQNTTFSSSTKPYTSSFHTLDGSDDTTQKGVSFDGSEDPFPDGIDTENSINTRPKSVVSPKERSGTRLSRNSQLQICSQETSMSREDKPALSRREQALKVVKHDKFEGLIAFLIMANALAMCFEVQYTGFDIGADLGYRGCTERAEIVWPAATVAFAFADWIFGLVFFAELVLKAFALALRYLMDPWNYLDLICVLAWLVDKVASGLTSGMNAQALRLLRLFRLIRLVRLLRIFEELDVLYILTTAIRGMTMILFWAVSLLSIILMTCALFLTQILHSTYFNSVTSQMLSPTELSTHHALYEHFGTFTRCFFSMFELALANWPPIARLLSEEISEWFMLITVIHKVTVGFAVVGVINGVILQETFKVAATDDMIMVRQKKRAQETLKKKMATLLEALDHSGDGELDFEEFETIASYPEVKWWLASMDIETDDLQTLFMLIDEDGSGTISGEELATRIPRLKGAARSVDVLALCKRLKFALPVLQQAPGFKLSGCLGA